MAYNSGNIDELLSSVVAMGFELEDGQQAIQMGKLTTEEIIEWILAGKPAPSSNQPTLKLAHGQSDGMVGANPFIEAGAGSPTTIGSLASQSTSAGASQSTSAAVSQSADSEAMDITQNVKSRLIVSEDQRVVRQKFEEKERLEAQRQARSEKLAQKKAKEEVLRRIQEDREAAKAKKAQIGSPPAEANKKEDSGSSPAKAAKTTSDSTTSMIQIRLPNGRSLRHRFDASDSLGNVLEHVRTEARVNTETTQLVQPFPRVVYTDTDMSRTLAELQLTPSGSLVLNSIEKSGDIKTAVTPAAIPFTSHPPSAPPNPQFESIEAQHMPGSDSDEDEGEDNIPGLAVGRGHPLGGGVVPGMGGAIGGGGRGLGGLGRGVGPIGGALGRGLGFGRGGGHNWGPGHMLEEVQANPMDIPDSAQQDAPTEGVLAADEGMEVNVAADDAAAQQYVAAAHAHEVSWNYDWGMDGQSLIGPVLNADMLPHRSKNPTRLAAEAASRRSAQVVECLEIDPPEASGSSSVQIDSLVSMVTRQVCDRMNDPRNPILGLQGLPADIAMKVLQHLIHERLLKPKLLNAFISCHLRSLVLDCYPYATNELLAAIRYHTYLVNLSLASCTLITDRGLLQLAGLKRLRVLNLSSCPQVTDNIFSLLKELPALVTVSLEGTGISDVGVTSYAQTAPNTLQSLNLNRTNVTHKILQALPAIPNLKVLHLEATKIESLSGIERIWQLECLNVANTRIYTDALLILSRCDKLTALNISDTPNVNGDQALHYITDVRLQYLQLPSRLTTTDEGIKHISEMPLRVLDMTNYIHVGDNGVRALAQITSLVKLRLGNTKITDEGLLYLQGLVALEELALDRTHVTDQGVSALSVLNRLTDLSLSETNISDVLLESRVLNTCGSLAKLNLSKTAISNSGIQALALSNLNVLNIDRTFVTSEVAQSLIDSSELPNLRSVIYRQAQTPPLDIDDD